MRTAIHIAAALKACGHRGMRHLVGEQNSAMTFHLSVDVFHTVTTVENREAGRSASAGDAAK